MPGVASWHSWPPTADRPDDLHLRKSVDDASNQRPRPADRHGPFLFLDIEHSTELLQQLGPEYPDLLATYRDLSGTLAAQNQGAIFGSEGDGLFLAFPEAGGALATAIGAQLAFAGHTWPGGPR